MKLISFAAAAMLLTAGAGAANAQVSGIDKTFAITVSQGNNAEVMSSQLALKKSSSVQVRKIAAMLVQQHGQAEVALKQVATMEKIMLPPGTDAKHRAIYRKLSRLSDVAFDRAYIAALVPDHYMTIGLFNKEMTTGTDSQIRSFAAKFLPAIQTHTQMITAVASNYNIPVAENRNASTVSSAEMSAK